MTNHDIIKEVSQKVVISNELIQKARYELNKTAQKSILYMASKIKPYDEPETVYTFNAETFCQVCNFNTDGGWYISYVKEVLLELKARPIVIPLMNRKRVITSWFDYAILDDETGEIKIKFNEYITPYLFELHNKYTSFMLEYILPMKSEYGIRLYEYLKSVKYQGYRHTITLDEMRQRVGCEGKYEQSSHLRERVIEPALKDINTYTDLDIGYKLIKTGRKATHIEFTILQNDDVARMLNRVDALGLRE